METLLGVYTNFRRIFIFLFFLTKFHFKTSNGSTPVLTDLLVLVLVRFYLFFSLESCTHQCLLTLLKFVFNVLGVYPSAR